MNKADKIMERLQLKAKIYESSGEKSSNCKNTFTKETFYTHQYWYWLIAVVDNQLLSAIILHQGSEKRPGSTQDW